MAPIVERNRSPLVAFEMFINLINFVSLLFFVYYITISILNLLVIFLLKELYKLCFVRKINDFSIIDSCRIYTAEMFGCRTTKNLI